MTKANVLNTLEANLISNKELIELPEVIKLLDRVREKLMTKQIAQYKKVVSIGRTSAKKMIEYMTTSRRIIGAKETITTVALQEFKKALEHIKAKDKPNQILEPKCFTILLNNAPELDTAGQEASLTIYIADSATDKRKITITYDSPSSLEIPRIVQKMVEEVFGNEQVIVSAKSVTEKLKM